jgi:hypothetical protein
MGAELFQKKKGRKKRSGGTGNEENSASDLTSNSDNSNVIGEFPKPPKLFKSKTDNPQNNFKPLPNFASHDLPQYPEESHDTSSL